MEGHSLFWNRKTNPRPRIYGNLVMIAGKISTLFNWHFGICENLRTVRIMKLNSRSTFQTTSRTTHIDWVMALNVYGGATLVGHRPTEPNQDQLCTPDSAITTYLHHKSLAGDTNGLLNILGQKLEPTANSPDTIATWHYVRCHVLTVHCLIQPVTRAQQLQRWATVLAQ